MPLTDARYLLDSAEAAALLQPDGPPALRAHIRRTRFGSVWISALTEGELRRLAALPPHWPQREAAVELLLRNVPTVPFDRAAAIAYGTLPHPVAGFGLRDLDLMLAAHALSTESILVTADTRYAAIPGLYTVNWRLD
jgi:tRNA(fMet)-specific endonuclease VapC